MALAFVLGILAVAGWVQAFRVAARLVDARVEVARLESRVLGDRPIYEQLGGL